MKKNIFIVAVIAALALFAACNDITHNIELETHEYTFDIDKFVDKDFFEVSEPVSLNVAVNSPFAATILKNGDVDIDASQMQSGKFVITPKANPTKYTRDITVYVRPLELQIIEGYGAFAYPVRIRQRGVEGSNVLIDKHFAEWESNGYRNIDKCFGEGNNHYVVGTITSVGNLEKNDGRRSTNDNTGDLWYVPATQQYFNAPAKLETRKMVLKVGTQTLDLMVHYFESYHLVQNKTVKVGDNVELFVPNSGLFAGEKTIWVSPQDIMVL